MDNPFGPVGAARYVLLTSFKKDGSPVASPVWAALGDGKLYVASNADSWKIKRIRRNPAVTLQPCSLRGKAHGEIVNATAVVLDQASSDAARRLIRRRYGIQGWIATLGSWLRRGRSDTIGIEITAA
ncbi:PPOX class F420-dependent oxidoreductase [Nocardia pneumoniae]|uniref:PPOX class F420-dependent oxidoreductase n=1 Tax=Nocardia pneumoniae TaxID=228601 RepID=UPI0005945430|nr:PPOX class F420-dependent oxidoreductase [Nocardia pneumoniae]